MIPAENSRRISILVVSLGEDPRLPECLGAALRACGEAAPVILVQNGVEGPGPPLLADSAGQRLTRIRRPQNPGFTGAWNEGFRRVRTPFVVSLNPDCYLDEDSIIRALEAFDQHPGLGAVALRLLRPGRQVLDSAGIRLGFLRRPHDRGAGQPEAACFGGEEVVDAACLAGAVLRTEAVLSAEDQPGEALDARFFAYKEDVDLGWRMANLGYPSLYLPNATAIHERGWKPGERSSIPVRLRRLSLRNRWLMIAKNESLPSFLVRLIPYLLWEAASILYVLTKERDLWPAYGEALRLLPGSFRRRRRHLGR